MRLYNFFESNIAKILATLALLYLSDVKADDSSLEIGGNYTRVDIDIGGDSFQGNLGGVQGSYEYKPQQGLYGGLQADWKQGKTSHSSTTRKLVYVDAQERIGYSFTFNCSSEVVRIFTGLGYRYLGHKLYDSNNVKFEYNEFYIPVGFLSEHSLSCNWAMGFNLIWMPQFYSTVKIDPLKGARWNLKNRMDNVCVEMPITYLNDNRCYSLVIKPFYEHWVDGASTAVTSTGQKLGLHKNTYNFWGIELNFRYNF